MAGSIIYQGKLGVAGDVTNDTMSEIFTTANLLQTESCVWVRQCVSEYAGSLSSRCMCMCVAVCVTVGLQFVDFIHHSVSQFVVIWLGCTLLLSLQHQLIARGHLYPHNWYAGSHAQQKLVMRNIAYIAFVHRNNPCVLINVKHIKLAVCVYLPTSYVHLCL